MQLAPLQNAPLPVLAVASSTAASASPVGEAESSSQINLRQVIGWCLGPLLLAATLMMLPIALSVTALVKTEAKTMADKRATEQFSTALLLIAGSDILISLWAKPGRREGK